MKDLRCSDRRGMRFRDRRHHSGGTDVALLEGELEDIAGPPGPVRADTEVTRHKAVLVSSAFG